MDSSGLLDQLKSYIEALEKERDDALDMLGQVARLKDEVVRLEAENNAWRTQHDQVLRDHQHCGAHILNEQKAREKVERALARLKKK